MSLSAQAGDLVQLQGSGFRSHLVRLEAGAVLQTHRGVIRHDDIIGQPWGSILKSHTGHPFYLFQPGLADLIREKFGVRASLLIFAALTIANLGTITVDIAAVKTSSHMLNLPAIPFLMVIVAISLLVVTRGNYKLTQGIMLFTSLFYLAYIISAVKAKPDWGMALANLVYPHGVDFTPGYLRNYLLIGMGVLGTTITPWGQFFISSFAYDKNIEPGKMIFSQLETYVGAFLTDFFSFFMIVATAATLLSTRSPLLQVNLPPRRFNPLPENWPGRCLPLAS